MVNSSSPSIDQLNGVGLGNDNILTKTATTRINRFKGKGIGPKIFKQTTTLKLPVNTVIVWANTAH
jgi:hypothetical protein